MRYGSGIGPDDAMIDGVKQPERGRRTIRHSAPLRAVHWLTVVLVGFLFVSNWLREASPHGTDIRKWWLQSHELAGLTVFALTLWRLGLVKAPGTGRLAQGGHAVFYAFLLILPIFGFLWAWFGASTRIAFWTLSAPMPRNMFMVHVASMVHSHLVAYVFLALIAGHVLAVLWHMLVRRDRLLSRML
ncbi:cytochrome b [Gluconacetobacter tumulicola]|uniref:cytochrome b n=2 Tax=Gluconacetobacter tumulicola TaxID=1017177 RepID=UPI0030845C39